MRRLLAAALVVLLSSGCMVGPGRGPRDNRPPNRPEGPPPPTTMREPDAARAVWFRLEAYDTRGDTAVPYRGITADVVVAAIGIDGRPAKQRDPITGVEFEGPDILIMRPLPYAYYAQQHATVIETSFTATTVGTLPEGLIFACWVEDEAGNEIDNSYTEAGPGGRYVQQLEVTCIYPIA